MNAPAVSDLEAEALERLRAGLRLNTAQVAALGCCSIWTVTRLAREGAIPSRRFGQNLTFAAADVARYFGIRQVA